MTSLVQPIMVAKTGTHLDTITAAAMSSVMSQIRNQEKQDIWREWLGGTFTKSVRRAGVNDFDKIISWSEENGVIPAEFSIGESRALALPPMAYDNYPKVVRKLQVSGTDFPRTDHDVNKGLIETDLTIYLDASLTTGKAAAQAAHAMWIGTLRLRLIRAEALARYSVKIKLVRPSDLPDLAEESNALAVVDSGLTEVAPNTLTAVVMCDLVGDNKIF